MKFQNILKSLDFTKIKTNTIILILVIIFAIIPILSILFTRFEKTITVSEKYIKPGRRRTHYRIIDNKKNTYEIVDSIFLLEFNSADDYAEMKEGQTYKINGYWFRFPLLSWFPKIYKFSSNT
jgi:hypothetical protein